LYGLKRTWRGQGREEKRVRREEGKKGGKECDREEGEEENRNDRTKTTLTINHRKEINK
jgi:hypothetical protein